MPHRMMMTILTLAIAFGAASGVWAQGKGFAGSYLAAMQADLHDNYAPAVTYYRRALVHSPDNAYLLQNVMIAEVATGEFTAAIDHAARLDALVDDNQVAGLVLLADALQRQDFARADAIIATQSYGFNPLFAGLISGWASVGLGDYRGAQDRFDALNDNDTLMLYGQYHKALALALAGDYAGAVTILKGDIQGPLHVSRTAILTHVLSLVQLDEQAEALQILDDTFRAGGDRAIVDLRARIEAGQAVGFDIITNASDGAAEAFYLLGDALQREEAQRFGLIYARLATHVRPGFDEALILAADILGDQDQHQLAGASYAKVAPASPWFESAEIGRANALQAEGKTEAALELLSALARAHPERLNVQVALGDMHRGEENHDAAIDAYSRAIDLLEGDSPSQWVLYYTRGISYERRGDWPPAEADFRKALALEPDQPQVLNYLGYSLVEKHVNMDEARAMIEKAVAMQPDDGYITDSLGWVLYRIGDYQEAVIYMERAVELKPLDPIINDHLGDVLWHVGRKREAEFQWRRALSFEPEEKDAPRIRRKLEVGLDAVYIEEGVTPAPAKTASDG